MDNFIAQMILLKEEFPDFGNEYDKFIERASKGKYNAEAKNRYKPYPKTRLVEQLMQARERKCPGLTVIAMNTIKGQYDVSPGVSTYVCCGI